MKNDRSLEDRKMADTLTGMQMYMRELDYSGGIYLVNREEMGFAYWMPTTWNAFIEDSTLDLGWRLRARQDELGSERAKELGTGAGWSIAAMEHFGHQTKIWGGDLRTLFEKGTGAKIDAKWPTIPRLGGINLRGKK